MVLYLEDTLRADRLGTYGYRFDTERVPESWRLEEDCHRNAAFIMLHAWHLPKLEIKEVETEKVAKNLYKVYIPVQNHRGIPSMSAKAANEGLHRPDIATLDGAKVLTAGIVQDRYMNQVSLQEHRPERLLVKGIGGESTRVLYYLVEGKGKVTFTYDSLKGGKHTKTIGLK